MSPREVTTLVMLARGWTNHQIAKRLGVSVATVKVDVSRARTELGARDRAHAVAEAIRRGLVHPNGLAIIDLEERSSLSVAPVLPPHLNRVLDVLADGRGAREVAAILGLSLHTVKTYLRQLYAALGTANRVETVALVTVLDRARRAAGDAP